MDLRERSCTMSKIEVAEVMMWLSDSIVVRNLFMSCIEGVSCSLHGGTGCHRHWSILLQFIDEGSYYILIKMFDIILCVQEFSCT